MNLLDLDEPGASRVLLTRVEPKLMFANEQERN